MMKPIKIGDISVFKTTQFFIQNIVALFFIPLMFDPISNWFKTKNLKIEEKRTILDGIYDLFYKEDNQKKIKEPQAQDIKIEDKKKRKKAKRKNPHKTT